MFFLRSISGADKPALQRFHARLSDESRYRRYHAYKGELSASDLRYLTEVDQDLHVAIVAVDAAGELAGVARVIGGFGPEAEIAVVVGDDRRGHGLGRLLCRRALVQFWARHDEPVLALVQGDNAPALRLFGPTLGGRSAGVECGIVHMRLTDPRTAAAAPHAAAA